MSEAYNNRDQARRSLGKRFLIIFVVCVGLIATLVASVNLVAYRYMLSEDNQAIVQLLAGWGRTYKPILYDEVQPQVAAFGASWARDAFDPIETGHLLGRSVFNHGVSGGTGYETRRFGDSALNNPSLEVAIINLDTFYPDKAAARFRYGFDESILSVDSERQPNHFVELRRIYSLALGGWAVGANLKLISTIMARDRGVAKPDYLASYQQADLTRRRMEPVRKRIFPEPGNEVDHTRSHPEAEKPFFDQTELGIMIEGFCDNGVDVYAYFTPSHSLKKTCDLGASKELATLEFLKGRQENCAARIHYYNFSYPNAMTLEGVLSPVTASRYYRPDRHPRPDAGLAMAASMFGKPYPGDTMPQLTQDFGVDLMTHADPQGWLLNRAARCLGGCRDAGYHDLARALKRQ